MPSTARVVGFMLCVTLLGCTDATGPAQLLRPVGRPASLGITPTRATVTGAHVRFVDADADSVRAHYVAAADGDAGVTPWVPASASAVLVLGLRSSTRYLVWSEAKLGAATAVGDTLSFVTQALPAALADARVERLQGGPLSGGYTLTSTMGADGRFFAVAYDSAGVVRWYRDLGFPGGVGDVQQQHDGHVTAGVGPSHGWDSASVHFVEVTSAGDSVRAIVATGSAFTDAHELIVDTQQGTRIADYLFGFDIRAADLTAFGGGPADPLAGHQVLRIDAAGRVDTLVEGWNRWSERDAVIGPPLAGDFDHPNSLSFDLDGGLVISYRALGSVVKLTPDGRSVAWVFGGTGNEFTLTGDPLGGFGGQHTVRVLENGHLLMFDNGWNHTPQRSRAVEYALDPATRTARMVWQYAAQPAVFVPYTGSAQRLANGNTVVTFTGEGFLDEVSPDGMLLSRMALRSGNPAYTPYRTQRVRSLYRYERP